MTTSDSDSRPKWRTRRRYRRLLLVPFAVGIVGLLAGLAVDRALVGTLLYLGGVVAGTAACGWARFRARVPLSDERDRAIGRRASYLTILTAGYAALAVFPLLFVLEAAGYYEFQPVVEGVLYALSGLFVLWGAYYTAIRHRT